MFFKPKVKTAKKKCEFKGCKEIFDGLVSGSTHGKYCHEHRKAKYRKEIDKDKIKTPKIKDKTISANNQIIKHSYKQPMVITCDCQCCGKKFDVMIIQNTYTYPRFCEEHRNEYKRERFLANGKTNNSII